MTKVQFTNLNATVYTMDGTHFNTDPVALVTGNFLAINDTTNLLGGTGKHDDKGYPIGTKSYGSLPDVEKMDSIQGNRYIRNDVLAAISFTSDFIPSPVVILASALVSLTNYLFEFGSGEILNSQQDVWEASTAIPYAGTVPSIIDIFISLYYSPSFSPYTLPKDATFDAPCEEK